VSDCKVAIVTGGRSGIGLAAAQQLACSGWKLILVGRSADELAAAALELEADAVAGDVADPATHDRATELALEKYGRLDGYLASAGTTGRSPTLKASLDEWSGVLAVNLTGVWLGVMRAIPLMMRTGGGSIVLISSVSGMVGGDNVAYSVSKAAVLQLTRSIAAEFGADNIRANSISPGWVRTPLADKGLIDMAERGGKTIAEVYDTICAEMPLGPMPLT